MPGAAMSECGAPSLVTRRAGPVSPPERRAADAGPSAAEGVSLRRL